MTELNILGYELGKLNYVKAMTDITGFGLLGHLIEVCEGSGLSAEIEYSKVPLVKNISHYISKFIYPDNTMRNWQSYEKKVNGIGAESLLTLCDPQTSGGLLVCVEAVRANEFENLMRLHGLELKPFGKLISKQETVVSIE
jgi:selenide,water dikinase